MLLLKDEPRMAHVKHSKRAGHDEVYVFDLKIAQDRGLPFDQTGSFPLFLYDTMPSEATMRVVKVHK